MMKRNVVISGILLAGSWAWALAPVSDETLSTYKEAARLAGRQVPRIHLNHEQLDDAVAERAVELFLNSLDYEHAYFLADDVERFKANAPEMDDLMRKGDTTFAFEVYRTLMERVSNRVAFVDTLLEEGLDVETPDTYAWKRKDAPWPEDEAAWNALWTKRLRNQYVGRVVAKQLADEAKAAETNETATATNEIETATTPQQTPEEQIRKEYRQYLNVLNDNDAHWLIPLYLTAFTRAYDPHSDYMSAHNTEDFDINMKLSLVGIGAILSVEDGAAKIVRLIPGGPAEKDGRLQAGDKIVAVTQEGEEPVDIIHWPLSKSVRLIRGEKGTRVTLTVIPASDPSGATLTDIDIVRDEVKLEEQAAKGAVRDVMDESGRTRRLGVIRVPDFYGDVQGMHDGNTDARSVSRDVRDILADFGTQDVDGVVLDLRNNGGGLLNEAVSLAGLFISRGPVVQYFTGRETRVLRDPDPDLVYDGPLIVLINRQSASASEIVAGALKDYNRALVVGDTKTHGKGTVQSLLRIDPDRPELGTLKLTTASFYRIDGSSTQREGVTPDIHLPSLLDYMEVGEEYLPHALPWSSITASYFRPFTNALPAGELRARSEARRATNEAFTAYRELLDELGRRKQAETIPLGLADRLTLARKEKAMADFFKEADEETPEEEDAEADEPTDVRNDIILREALNILADMVAIAQPARDEAPALSANTLEPSETSTTP